MLDMSALTELIAASHKARTTWIGYIIMLLGLVDAGILAFDLGMSPLLTILVGMAIITGRHAIEKNK